MSAYLLDVNVLLAAILKANSTARTRRLTAAPGMCRWSKAGVPGWLVAPRSELLPHRVPWLAPSR